jgi:hypothetical protein
VPGVPGVAPGGVAGVVGLAVGVVPGVLPCGASWSWTVPVKALRSMDTVHGPACPATASCTSRAPVVAFQAPWNTVACRPSTMVRFHDPAVTATRPVSCTGGAAPLQVMMRRSVTGAVTASAEPRLRVPAALSSRVTGISVAPPTPVMGRMMWLRPRASVMPMNTADATPSTSTSQTTSLPAGIVEAVSGNSNVRAA